MTSSSNNFEFAEKTIQVGFKSERVYAVRKKRITVGERRNSSRNLRFLVNTRNHAELAAKSKNESNSLGVSEQINQLEERHETDSALLTSDNESNTS